MSGRNKVAGTVAIAASASLALAACGGGAGGPQSGGDAKLTNDKVVIGLLNDQSGVYKDLSGPNSKVAIEMAIADYQAKYGDKAVAKTIEVVQADHQNKPDIANTKAQEMYDRQNADIILDVPTSSAALAVAKQAQAKKKMYINIGAATTALTGESCNKYTFHWAYDTFMLAHGTGTATVKNGGKTWSIVYPDYAFGQDMNKSFTAAIDGAGGEVQQSIPTPFPNDNFATFITKAASTNPDVVGIMAAGGDLINFVKQYNQAGMQDKATLAVGLMFITDIHSLGVEQFSGTQFTDAWYWNFDDENRKWADRFQEKTNTRPSFAHAGNYSAALKLPRGDPGGRHGRRGRGRGQARGQEDQRRLPAQRRDPRRRPPRPARRLPGQGQDQGPGQGGLGLRGDPDDDPRGRGLRAGVGRLQDVT